MKLFHAPFYTDGRIARLEYILSFLIWIGIDVICNFLFGSPGQNIVYGIISLVLFVFIICQGAKRCHDIGKSGWWQLIPFFFVWLFIAKGDEEENEYGSLDE